MRGDFRMGEWRVEPDLNRLVHSNLSGHEVRIDPKAMQVLVYMRYIQTVPRKGYRLVAEVTPDERRTGEGNGEERSFFRRRIWVPLAARYRRPPFHQTRSPSFRLPIGEVARVLAARGESS